MKKRNVLHSPRLSELKKRRRKAVLTKIIFVVILFSMAGVALVYASRIPRLNISKIEVVGNKVIDTEDLRQVVEKEINKKYLWVLPKTNIFFYPKDSLEKNLADQFKRIKTINLAIKDGQALEISVTEREALYTWCGPAVQPLEGKCYFLDSSGYIFAEAPYFSGDVYFRFYGPSTYSYFQPEIFDKLILFKTRLESMKLKPVALLMDEGGNIKIFLSGFSGKKSEPGPEIILKTDSDFTKSAENLESALETEPMKTEFKNKYSALLYIDLRFGNKVYYKFR